MENLYGTQHNESSNNSSNIIWIVVIVILVIVVGVSLDSNDGTRTLNQTIKGTKTTKLFQSRKTTASIQSIKDIEQMREAIDNTVWTYTKRGSLFWHKLVFKGGKVEIYSAMPSDGKWKFDEVCNYTLEEGRFIDDGRRYIAAVIKSKEVDIPAKFTITNGHLYMLGIDVAGFILGDYEWD